MSKKLIGITANDTLNEHEWDEFARDYTPHGYVDGVIRSENIPMIIPIHDDLSRAKDYIDRLDGLIFTGGQDVHPLLYGEDPSPKLQDIYPRRDHWEKALFSAARIANLPILAVCRGFQLINVLLGGTIYQDLDYYPLAKEQPRVQHVQKDSRMLYPHHSIKLKKESLLASMLNHQEIAYVNSYHHQVIRRLAEPLEPTSWSADGIIESYEYKSENTPQQLIGVQWHPEIMIQHDDEMMSIFNWFNQF